MKDVYQRIIFSVLGNAMINRIVRTAVKPLAFLLPRSIVSRIPVVGEVRIPVPDSRDLILFSDGTDQIASRIYWGGLAGYEPGTIDIYLRLLKKSRIVFDIGANTGLFSILAALSDSVIEVHSFEPVGRIYEYLLRNIERNGAVSIRPVCKVVAARDGVVPFYEPQTVMLPSSASLCQGIAGDNRTEVMRPAIMLDTYTIEGRVGKVDLIKLDVEGAESAVFEGAKGLIARDRPVILCEVLRGTNVNYLQTFFDEAGYVFFRITKGGPVAEPIITGGETERDWNYLFTPVEKASEFC